MSEKEKITHIVHTKNGIKVEITHSGAVNVKINHTLTVHRPTYSRYVSPSDETRRLLDGSALNFIREALEEAFRAVPSQVSDNDD